MTGLSIVIVSFNAKQDLVACLTSLREAPPRITHDIFVIDNHSTDGSVECARAFPGVRVLALERNAGFACANNIGIRQSERELILLLNSDTLAPPGAIDRLVERLLATPSAAVAGPRLVDGRGRVERSFGPMISPVNELRQKVLLALHSRGFGPAVRRVERDSRHEQFVDWVSGACLLVRRADAEAAGLLDERFFMYTEDVDFCAAIRARGRRVLFTPAAEIVHLRGRSRAAAPTATALAYRRSHLAFYEKHHPHWVPVLKLYLRLRGA